MFTHIHHPTWDTVTLGITTGRCCCKPMHMPIIKSYVHLVLRASNRISLLIKKAVEESVDFWNISEKDGEKTTFIEKSQISNLTL